MKRWKPQPRQNDLVLRVQEEGRIVRVDPVGMVTVEWQNPIRLEAFHVDSFNHLGGTIGGGEWWAVRFDAEPMAPSGQ